MATKGKQLRFNLERERERSCFSCGRRGRRVLEFSCVGTLPSWTKLSGSWWPCTLTSSPASLRSPRETFLSNSTEREKTGAGSNLGQTSWRTRRTQASSSSWSGKLKRGQRDQLQRFPLRMWEEKEVLLRPDLCLRARSEDEQGADSSAPGQDEGSIVLNHETVKQTRQTDQRNAKQFSSTASDATPPAVL